MEDNTSQTGASASSGLVEALAEIESSGSALDPSADFMAAFNADAPEPAEPAKGPDPEAPGGPGAGKSDAVETPEAAGAESEESGEEDPHGDEAPDPKDEKSNTRWKEIKGDLKKTRAELRAERDKFSSELRTRDEKIAEYETKKAELELQIAELAEAREKAARVEEVEKELSIHRVESSDSYKKAVTEPLNAISSRLEEIAKINEIGVDDLYNAVGEPDPAKQRAMLKEIYPSLDPVDQAELARMVGDTRTILAKRDQIKADAANAAKELESKQAAETAKARETARREFSSAVEHAAGELKKKFPHVELAKGETADAVFASLLEKAKQTDFDAASPSTKAFAALSGVAIVRALKIIQHQTSEIETLKARISEETTAEPKVQGETAAALSAQPKDFLSDIAAFTGATPNTASFIP